LLLLHVVGNSNAFSGKLCIHPNALQGNAMEIYLRTRLVAKANQQQEMNLKSCYIRKRPCCSRNKAAGILINEFKA